MNKRGQFFLIAAVVIVVAVASLSVVYNRASSPKEEVLLYDLSKEISFEGAKVIDSGVFNSLSQSQIESNIKQITQYYSDSNPENDILVVYGDSSAIQFTCEDTGSAGISLSGASSALKTCRKEMKDAVISKDGGIVKVKFSGESAEMEFEIQEESSNFYIILRKETEGGRTIVTS